jgi:hypothetical protein
MSLDEGARAVRCASCREPYLVPPWQYPFAAVVNPAIDTTEGRRIARNFLRAGQHRATQVGRGQWRLLPFWRHRSAAFQWLSGERHGGPRQSTVDAERDPGTGTTGERAPTKAEFHDLAVQRLDLLFSAADRERTLEEYQPPAGMRAAYPLDSSVTAGAALEPVQIDFAAARQEAREEVERRCAAGDRAQVRRRRMTLVSEEMILIYLPFFTLEYHFRDEVHEVVVDGVGGTVTAHRMVLATGGDPDAKPTGDSAPAPESGHAPLLLTARCPACTAVIEPRSPAARVYGCVNCWIAWEVAGGQLRRVDQHLAVTEADGPTARYLPFWNLDVEMEQGAHRAVFVPAFEGWQVERLGHLGVHLTRAEPQYATTSAAPGPTEGDHAHGAPALSVAVSVGRDDAERLAWVVLGSLASANALAFDAFLSSSGIAVRSATLLWLPFRQSGLYLREPVSGALVRDLPVEIEMPVLESGAWTSEPAQRSGKPDLPSASAA